MVTSVSIPSYYGFEEYISNGGSCQNKGYELGIFGKILNGDLKWEIDANFSQYENEVLHLENDRSITSFTGGEKINQVGFPMGQFYGYRSLGVFIDQENADQADLTDNVGRKFNAGDIHFDDLDGNGVIDEKDKTIIGNPHPESVMGWNNHLSYRGISLDFFIYCVKGVDVFNYLRSQLEGMSGVENQSTAVYNRWIIEGQETNIPGASFGDPMGNNRFSSRWIEDASYIRLKSITLSYTYPRKLAFVKELNVYVTGTNLITWTKYLGYDPEFSYADGVLGQGIDYGKFPQTRSMVVGLKIGL